MLRLRCPPDKRCPLKNRRLLIIFVVVLVDMLSFSIVLPLLPYLAGDIGASEFQIGLLTATYPLAQLFGAPLLGRLSDRFGRKPVLLASLAGTAVGFVVLATARALPILFVSRFIDGITGGNISVAQAYIADVTEEKDRGRALGLIGAAFGLGFILGPMTGGLLSEYSYALPVFVGAAVAALDFIAIVVFVPESLSPEDRARISARKRRIFDVAALRAGLQHPRVGPLLGVRTGTALSFAMFESTFALWGIAALGLSARTNGLILAYVGILGVFVQVFLIGRLTDRFSDDTLLATSVGVSGVALALWGFMPSVAWLLVLMPALSFGLGVTNTIMSSALSKAVDRDEVGGIMGVQTSIMSAGRIFGPILGGWLIGYATTWSPGAVAGALSCAAAIFAWRRLCISTGRGSCEIAE